MIRVLLLIGLCLFPVGPACAQFGILESLFKNVNSVSFGMQGGWLGNQPHLTSDAAVSDLFGLSTEVYINLPAPEGAFLELALGTSYLRGFQATNETLDLRGSMRALPTISVYLTLGVDTLKHRPFKPHLYMGANFGFVELWNVQAYRQQEDSQQGRASSVQAQTYEYGATVGVNVDLLLSISFFLEANYKNRRFASLDWRLDALPAGWPRDLDLSGFGFSVGVQFELDI